MQTVACLWKSWLLGAAFGWLLMAGPGLAQDGLAPSKGLHDGTPRVYALQGARVVISPEKELARGTVVIRDGVIVAVGEDIAIPPDAVMRDYTGKTLYAGFIDAYSEIEVPQPKGGGYWNPEVRPHASAAAAYSPAESVNAAYRRQGVTVRLVAPKDGIIRGTSALVTTGKNNPIVRDQAALHVTLIPARRGRDQYPGSPMGAMALVRQALIDADWHHRAWQAYESSEEPVARPERSAALTALEPYAGGRELTIFEAQDELYALRADAVAQEFQLKIALRGSGNEYRRLDAIAATGWPVIVPLNFPKAPYVKTPEAAMAASLERLMHWDHAPENPARLAAAGVTIAFTGHNLPSDARFLDRVRMAVGRGLPPKAALAALTVNAARLFGVERELGTIEPGKAAHLVVTDGDVFAQKTKVLETWVDGEPYTVQTSPELDVRGTWKFAWTDATGKTHEATLRLEGTITQLKGKLKIGNEPTDLTDVKLENLILSARLPGKLFGNKGQAQLTGAVAESGEQLTWVAAIFLADGSRLQAAAQRKADQAVATKPPAPADDEPVEAPPVSQEPAKATRALFAVNYPLGAYGRTSPPESPEWVVFQGGTIWTSGPQGVIEDGVLVVHRGRIHAVGKAGDVEVPKDALLIDCRGKHLTPGLIDCHSHTATDGGINEATQSITAEVRIGDFIDPDDINIYRQLAGGLTTANVLHGSANTIGGQNQVIKLRWGSLPEEMKFVEAPAGIKFALGENVKQSNWGERYTTRYPQTRMGVEQLVRDAFEAALEYRRQWQTWETKPQGLPPRRDLELEALVQILEGKRLIHCHSYRQDEILALLRTCEAYNVRIGTLQHILEGYKLADQIARHGAGASSFSDWWAYKFEVWDAIPYNGALMHQQGVVVSFNSDDSELARRLNGEAAKAVKYGDVPPQEALKFVTLNPARQLRIDQWVGSLEQGKHADLVVWSGPPLSPLSVCEQTWIDGRKYFDRQEAQAAQEQANAMKAALVQRILATKAPMAGLDEEEPDDTLWPREDIYCHHHDGHGHGHGHHHGHDGHNH